MKTGWTKIILIIFLVGSLLRLYQLDKYSLWKDELFSAVEAQKPLSQLLTTKSYAHYGYAPVHYVFTHLAMVFGEGDFVVRLPSVLFGLLTIVTTFFLTKSIFGKKAGLFASFLLAILTVHIQYSREVRYYSYLVFFSSLTMISAYKIVAEKKKLKWVFIFLFSTLFNLATQLTALLVLSSEIVFLTIMLLVSLFKKRKSLIRNLNFSKKALLKKTLLAVGTIVILILIAKLAQSFRDFLQTATFKPAISMSDAIKYISISLGGSKELAAIFSFFFILGSVLGFQINKDGTILLLLTFFLPLLITYLYRLPVNPGFIIRYIIFIVIPYLGLISVGALFLFKFKPLFYLLSLLILVLSYQPLKNYYSTTRGDWRGVASYIKANADKGDVIIPDGDYNTMLLDYYLKAEKNGFIIKNPKQTLHPQKTPFRIYYLQHDYLKPEGKPNPEALPVENFGKIIPFEPQAKVSPMYLYSSQLIYFWQEAEESWSANEGWYVSDFYDQKLASADSISHPNATVVYSLEVPEDGKYNLYANLRWDDIRSILRYRIDDNDWSAEFQPLFKNDWKLKEKKLGSFFLNKGAHKITFLNKSSKNPAERYQTIDYFYLTKDNLPQ